MKTLFGIVAVGFLSVGVACGQIAASTNPVVKAVEEAVTAIQSNSIPLDVAAAKKAAVEAVVKVADPQARFLSEQDLARMKEEQRGMFYEVGLSVAISNGQAIVKEVKKGTDAEKAGLKAGEVIDEMDKGNISALAPSEVAELLRGPSDETVLFKLHDGTNAAHDVKGKRDKTEASAVQSVEMLPAGIGYIRINGLYAGSTASIVPTLRGWSETNKAGVVIDLRGADGADLTAAYDVASVFADPGAMLFALRDATDQELEVHKAGKAKPVDMPAMVLVDERTTAAAEVLAAALADSVRGVMLLGTATSGDPMIRDPVKLPDGGYLYIVTKRLVTADGKKYDGKEGVRPDLEVNSTVTDESQYEPEPVPNEKQEVSKEEKENRKLRDRVRGDPALRRAVDILLGLKALNVRGTGQSENSEP